jgi:hypothetical protein
MPAALGALAAPVLLLGGVLARARRPAAGGRPIAVDGSNVMHWRDGSPQIEPLAEVIAHLRARGYEPGVVFDANAGYPLASRYRHDGAFARLLGLREANVMVVPKGTQADAYLLQAARDLGARIVTDDHYRDWAEAHPEVRDRGHLVRGGCRDGVLWLSLGGDAAPPGEGAPAQTVSR